MADDQFAPGAAVQLRCGGPIMTLVSYGDFAGLSGGDVRRAHCRWFNDKHELKEDYFADAELKARVPRPVRPTAAPPKCPSCGSTGLTAMPHAGNDILYWFACDACKHVTCASA